MEPASLLISPRLRALRAALEHDADSLDAFWLEIQASGAPLIEPVEGDDSQRLVTFLWRGDPATEHVLLWSHFTVGDIRNNALTQLPGTDIWYRTYQLRSDLRTTYALSLNNPLTTWKALGGDDAAYDRHWCEFWQPDPLNPQTYALPHDPVRPLPYYEHPQSRLELPHAPPQRYVAARPDLPQGTLTASSFRSTILGNERRVWIYTPPGYQPDGPAYPLALFTDGWFYHVVAPTILDNLHAEGRIPGLVAVFIDNTRADRWHELTCSPAFADFLSQEILAWASAQAHVAADPAQTMIAGVSLGGLCATYTAWRHPDRFGLALSQTGSYWWAPEGEPELEWLARQVAASEPRAVRVYLDVGRLEYIHEEPFDGDPTQLTANRHMRTVLQAKGYPVHYAEYTSGHEFLAVQGSLAEGLTALLGSAAAPGAP